jgi:Arc/MetJ-type ribon-helix-helix transcriptional regulator
MKLISLNIPESDLKKLEKMVEAKKFPHKSEAIRHAIKRLIEFEDANDIREREKLIANKIVDKIDNKLKPEGG